MMKYFMALVLITGSAFAQSREITGPAADTLVKTVSQNVTSYLAGKKNDCTLNESGELTVLIKDNGLEYSDYFYFDLGDSMVDQHVFVDDTAKTIEISQSWDVLHRVILTATYADSKVSSLQVYVENDPKDTHTVNCQ